MSTSIFESPELERTLFFPSTDPTSPPPGAFDRHFDVAGAQIRVRIHRPERSRCLLCFVGNGENAGSYDGIAGTLGELAGGIAVAVADHRGYGKSTGTPRFRELLDDARRIVAAFADERGTANLVLYGRSLGSQAVLHALADTSPTAVVIDSGFSSLDAFVARRGVPPSAITAADRARFDVLPHVRAYPGPLLGLHGTDDELIAPADGRAITEVSSHPHSRFVTFAGHGHNDLFAAAAYFPTLDAWLRTALPAS
jgi:alpha-beta hydrolase superfamily lysophospholipase